jgi:predicted MPP superfamily phosphohydrolase
MIVNKIIIIFALILFVSVYLWCQNNLLSTSIYEITSKKLPSEFNDFKIVHISDFHNVESEFLRNGLVEEIKKQKPDMIAITGDLVDCRTTNVDIALDFVAKIVEIAPVYYVNGNHESNLSDYAKMISKMKELGVVVMDNKSHTISIGETSINVVGVNDPLFTSGVDDVERIKKALKEADYDHSKYTILLSHRPELLPTYAVENIDLALTGHAHGGQIRIPFVGGIISPGEGFFPKLTSGVHKIGNTTMVISRGIGNSAFPFRINNRPELVIVTLRATT